jgi:hypothetical protein
VTELPKIVLQRLASAVPGEHPPADLLAAFAEHSLQGAERERLLAHLAACEHCCAVLWCAMPENEAAPEVVAGVASSGWAWSSAWRWVGVAAAVVVIGGAAVLFRGGPGPAGEEVASAPQAPVIAQNRDAQALARKEAARAPAAPVPAPSAEARLEVRNVPPKAAPQPRLQAKLEAKDAAPKGAPAAQEPPSANEIASGTLAKSTDQVAAAGARSSSSAAGIAAAAPAAKVAAASANPVPASTSDAEVMIASNVPVRAMGKKKLAPPTRWMLSPEGTLLRSTDLGKNWQAVPFTGSVTFHAVAVVGTNVWVGGQAGALYYSPDDGSQWQRLSPSAAGEALRGDISSLAFRDGQHGSLTTTGGQTWTTSDSGLTWQKQ